MQQPNSSGTRTVSTVQKRYIENCTTFGQFVHRVNKMTNNNDVVAFEGVARNRREACVFILEQRDTYAPPALSASAVAKVWTQLGCAIDVSRVVSPEVALRRQQSGTAGGGANNASSPSGGSASSKRAEGRRAKSGLLPSSRLVSTLESMVTSIEWASVTVCGKKLNAGGCYVNALEMDPKCNAAAWFNLGCWLSSETKEVVKGNARAMAMVKAEEDEERNVATAKQSSASRVRPGGNRYGIPRGAAPPGGRPPVPPLQQQSKPNQQQSASPPAVASPSSGSFLTLPAAPIERREYTAAMCFAQAVAVDNQLQGGWLNLGAALALEQLLEKRGALPLDRPPITIESIEELRRKMKSDGNTNIGYLRSSPPPPQSKSAASATSSSSERDESAATTTTTNKNSGQKKGKRTAANRARSGMVTRQFCYIKELEANMKVSAAARAPSCPPLPLQAEGTNASIEQRPNAVADTNANLIGPSSLSSPFYLANHPGAINAVTFTDSAPSSEEENAKAKKLRHERRVSRYRQLAITADSRGPSRATVRALAWVNLAATFEAPEETVTVTVRDFHVPLSHTRLGGLYVKPNEPARVSLTKKQCLEAALAEDPTISKAWLNLGAAMDEDESIILITGETRERKERINRVYCFAKAIEAGNDANPALWMNIAVSLFEGLKAAGKASRVECVRVPLKSRRRINGNSGNPSVHEQREAILDERAARKKVRLEAEAAALEAAYKAAAEGVSMPLSKAQLDRLNYLNPNLNLIPKKRENKRAYVPPPTPGFDYDDDDEDEDAPIGVCGQTFDCIDCLEEYLSRSPDDSKAWLLLAHMFQYFLEDGKEGGNGAAPNSTTTTTAATASEHAKKKSKEASVGALPTSVAEAVALARAALRRQADGDDAFGSDEEEYLAEEGTTSGAVREKGIDEEEWEDVEEDEEAEEENENDDEKKDGDEELQVPAAKLEGGGAKAKDENEDGKVEEHQDEEDEEQWEDVEEDEEGNAEEEEEEEEKEEEEANKAQSDDSEEAMDPNILQELARIRKEAESACEEPALSAAIKAAPSISHIQYLPCELFVSGGRYASPREIFAEVVRCEPENGEIWYTLGNYLYYDPKNSDGLMTVRIGRSRRAEALTYKECYSKAQSLGAMSRFACCTIM